MTFIREPSKKSLFMQVFHVFHSACLIEWIVFCEAKTWNASCTSSRKLKRRKAVHPNVQAQACGANVRHDCFGTETEFTSETGIFCPECQGTGVKLEGPQLERPRFRLNQVRQLWLSCHRSWLKSVKSFSNALEG